MMYLFMYNLLALFGLSIANGYPPLYPDYLHDYQLRGSTNASGEEDSMEYEEEKSPNEYPYYPALDWKPWWFVRWQKPHDCSQPIDPGHCPGLSRRYGYDRDTGKCIFFIYGGCGGNSNNFENLLECEAYCQRSW